jgi:hypothetical protein
MKRLLFFNTVLVLLLTFFTQDVLAQSSAGMSCIPVQQLAQNKTQIECRITSSELQTFTVAEISFPFRVTGLIKVSSGHSATLGTVYPSRLSENTVVVSSIDWGTQTVPAGLREVPFDSLSLLLETDQSMGTLKRLFTERETQISYLSENPANPSEPLFQTFKPQQTLSFDGSLVLESFTQNVSPGVLQFLRIGIACYEKTPQACLTNIIQNL